MLAGTAVIPSSHWILQLPDLFLDEPLPTSISHEVLSLQFAIPNVHDLALAYIKQHLPFF